MLHPKGPSTLSVIVLVLYVLTTSGSSQSQQHTRHKRQILSDQPRIVTQNGHLVFQGGASHNITFRSGAGGGIFLDDLNLKVVATQVTSNKASIDSMRSSTGNASLERRLRNIENQLSTLTSLSSRVDRLSSTFDSLRNRVDNTVSSLGSRMTQLENRVSSAGGSSSTMLQVTHLMTQFQDLEHRVNDVEGQTETLSNRAEQEIGTAGRGMRRLRRGVRSLTNRVENLETLLDTNECSSNPCLNGGSCVDLYNGFTCRCPANFQGSRCDQDVNECVAYAGTDLGCQNGATCINMHGGFTCQCASNWHGIHCNERHDDCTGASHAELCGHGTCVNADRVQAGQPRFRCICETGWTTEGSNPACTRDVDECASGRHCSSEPPVLCINLPGSYTCGSCPAGYTGNGYTCSDINECLVNNGGCSLHPLVQCRNGRGSSSCGPCPTGYTGDGRVCEFRENLMVCNVNNGGCHPDATCTVTASGRTCRCPSNLEGSGVGVTGCRSPSCGGLICQNGATCTVGPFGPECQCAVGWSGVTCAQPAVSCQDHTCQNGGTCRLEVTSQGSRPRCLCPASFTGTHCEMEQSECGGLREADSGTLVYPSVDGQYSHDQSCGWTIRVSPNKRVSVTFTAFHLEEDSDCDFDKVEIYDGDVMTGNSQGVYCGHDIPNGGNPILSTGNSLYVHFSSDASVAGDGFTLTWQAQDQGCGGVLTGNSSGQIVSPGYPNDYPHDTSCVWTVHVPAGNLIRFTFSDMAIETHSTCAYDWLEIRDGPTSDSPLLQKYCTTTTPEPFQTTTSVAYVAFHTDSSFSDRGFSLAYSTPTGPDGSASGCGAQLTGDNGTFQSPGYPSHYPHLLDCVWTITTSPGSRVRLTFADFALEDDDNCEYDYVQVLDGDDNEQGMFCGNTLPAPISVDGNQMQVFLRTDHSISVGGFRATWSIDCSQRFTSDSGDFIIHTYPSTVCRYVIQVSPGNRVLLQFMILDVGPMDDTTCQQDYYQVYDGDSESSTPIGGRICNGNRREVIRSTSRTIMIKLTMDAINNNNNMNNVVLFRAETTGTPICGGALTNPAGPISSPGYPNFITSGANCTWHVHVDAGLVVKLNFRFFELPGRTSSGCESYVDVFDGESVDPDNSLGRFCGRIAPAVLITSDNAMTIHLQMGTASGFRGFQAVYRTSNASTACGSELTESTGVVTSPNFPSTYPHGRDCTWVIRGQNDHTQVSLTFTNFSIEQASDCGFDYLEIRDGPYPMSPVIRKLCGPPSSMPPRPIVSSSNALYLHFHSDSSVTETGFRLEYDATSTGCGAVFTTPTGSIVSPNYPQPYNHDAVCTWSISVSRGSRITLTFEDFDLEEDSSCGYDGLQIRDRDEAGDILTNGTRSLCGYVIPANITSLSNKVWIRLTTDYSISGRGFILHYHQECSGTLTDPHGVIESPNFPHPYPHRINCTWTLQAPLSNRLNVSIVALNVEKSGAACPYDSLQFRNGSSTTSPLLHEYCGRVIPDPFRSPSNLLFVSFTSDSSVSYGGFRLEYVFDGCGGIITGNSGTLTSPGYPGNYDHTVECVWRVTADLGKSLQVTVHELDVEDATNCRYDSLEIFAGLTDAGPRIAQLCGRHSSMTYSVNGNTMFVKFRSDYSISGNGFRVTFEATDGGCGGNFTGDQGTLVSPGFPNRPTTPTQCDWLITVNPHTNVVLNFTHASFYGWSCDYGDSLTIYNGANDSMPEGMTVCAGDAPEVFRSMGNQVFLRYSSIGNLRTNVKGFSLNYTTGCGGIITVQDSGNSVVQSPGYPAYADRYTQCDWTIQSPPGAYGVPISLSFLGLDIDPYTGCDTSYVQVSTGQANGTKYCGHVIPSAVYGTDLIRVKFVSTYIPSKFKAIASSYHAGCGGDIQADAGRFASPAFPDNYPPGVQCVWQIRVAPGNQIQLAFSQFNLNSYGDINGDYLEVRSPDVHGQLIGRWIDQDTPTNLTALGGAWVKFRSADSTVGPGFLADWNTMYGGTLTGDGGQVASPRYPHRYPSNAYYRWTITVAADRRVRLDFIDLLMERRIGGSCDNADYLKIYDQDDTIGELLGTFCATDNPGRIYSTSPQVTLIFRTDSSVQTTGFLANWTSVAQTEAPRGQGGTGGDGCHGDLYVTDDLQTLVSPGNLTGYENNMNCEWTVHIPEGMTALINITYIYLEGHSNCGFDFLAISEDGGVNSQKFCGRDRGDSPIRLSGERGSIRFVTDSSVTRTGFQLTYTKDCGGLFNTMTSARISSPQYPRDYPSNANCSWVVLVRPGKTVVVDFNQTFNIADTGTCENDYLQLLNGQSVDSPPLYPNASTTNTNGRYCGNTAPSQMETSSNWMNVQFVSDDQGVDKGFSFNFTEKSVACGGRISLLGSAGSQIITSPNYPNAYPHHVDCEWVVVAPAETRIQVDFVDSFRVEDHSSCRFDYVMFRDGMSSYSPVLGSRVCGYVLPSTVLSRGSVLYMRFVADGSVTSTGFKAVISLATCGGRITARSGEITNPGYPLASPTNQDCEWLITVPVGHYVTMTTIEYSRGLNCSNPLLEVRDGNSTGHVIMDGCRQTYYAGYTQDSADNQVWVKYTSSGSGTARFKMSFNASTEVCGGDLTTSAGTITSPNYPRSYAHRRRCIWKILVQEGRSVTLTFDDVDIEQHAYCQYDHLAVYNGIISLSPLIGRFCGSGAIAPVQSSGNSMTVVFQTDVSITGRGFSISYTSDQPAECGGLLMAQTGNITNPGFNQTQYNHSVQCEWRIQNPSPVNSSLVLRFNAMSLEYGGANCRFDSVRILEGRTENSPLIDKYCGDTVPTQDIYVPGPDVLVVFRTDTSVAGDGFRLLYEMRPCGGVLTEPGIITSPNYPNDYHHNDNCAWKIVAPEGYRIKVQFEDFSFENHSACGFDYLQIYNGGLPDSPASHPRCGSTLPEDFLSQGNQIRLHYKTDYSYSSRGFKLNFTFTSEGCGGLYHSMSGDLASPNYPSDYPHNTECRWDINVPLGNIVRLTFNPPFDLEAVDCVYDYVKVYDSFQNGSLVIKGTWCHNDNPPVITSTTTRMVVVFRSDESTNGNGFSASWQGVCGGLFEQKNGIVHSPGYPRDYDNNLVCTYSIRPPGNSFIDMSFRDLEMEGSPNDCDYDNLTIQEVRPSYYRRPVLGTFCGRTLPDRLMAMGGVDLTFRTDVSQTYRGFQIYYYSQPCGGVFNRPSGNVFSAFYNRAYLHNMDCSWNITVAEGMVVSFKFRKFELEPHRNCAWDSVSFYDGPDEYARLIGKYCGTMDDVPRLIRTTGNRMYIRFRTDHSVAHAGFRGGYWSSYGPDHGCGGTIQRPSGTLTSFNADDDGEYENGLDCEWTLVAGINTVLSLNVSDLDIERHPTCIYDSVSVYDGPSLDYPLLGKFCGTQPPARLLNSTTNVMLVVFKTDYSVTQGGFNITYTSAPSICGGAYNVTFDPNVITSVDYPRPYPLPIRCSWILDTGNPAMGVTVNVTDIQLTSSRDCNTEYLLIRDFPLGDNGRQYHYCGSRLPQAFDSQGQIAQIVYFLEAGSTGRGFQLSYQVADCNKNYVQSSGHVTHPRRDGRYGSGLDCVSNVTSPAGTYLSLYFYLFDLEGHHTCVFDFLQIQNSTSDVVAKLCGRSLPNPIFLPDNSATLRFKTDGSVTRYGYDITYVASASGPGCGGSISSLDKGAITSPQYPSASNTSQTCTWTISPPARSRLYFRFDVLSGVDADVDCGGNHVTAERWDPSQGVTSFGEFCRSDVTPSHQWDNDQDTVIRYVNSGHAPIFRLQFTTTPPSTE